MLVQICLSFFVLPHIPEFFVLAQYFRLPFEGGKGFHTHTWLSGGRGGQLFRFLPPGFCAWYFLKHKRQARGSLCLSGFSFFLRKQGTL